MFPLLSTWIRVTVFLMLQSHAFSFSSKSLRLIANPTTKQSRFFPRTGALFSSTKEMNMKPKVLVAVADGSEEIEAVTIIDTLVRGGAEVTVASVMDKLEVRCSRGVKLLSDCKIHECIGKVWDLICVPGGMPGATHLSNSESLTNLLLEQNRNRKLIGAICAAPAVVLAKHGLLHEKRATCYPAEKFTSQLHPYLTENVVIDHNIITSKGPGTALEFSLSLVGILFGRDKEEELKREMLFHA